jgi:hypothetical protein
MNIYFLKDREDDFIMWTVTALNMTELVKVLNNYFTNLCVITPYTREAQLYKRGGVYYIDVYDQYKDEKEDFLSGTYLVLERQYSPDRVYDLV